jgi:alpha-galactosidase
MRRAFPDVLFETCSSGGMRMDYATLSHFSIVSTSDQTSYLRYPYIAGNVLSAVLPEQAAVWSYPVGTDTPGFTPTAEWVNKHISDEQIIMNMINSLLGRIHLASHIELLHKDKIALIKEGLDFYDGMTTFKKAAVPYLPLGLTRFGKKQVAAGLLHEGKLLLAVWNLGGEREMRIPLTGLQPVGARIAYPADARGTTCTLDADTVTVHFTEDYQARMLEITLN